MKALVNLCTDLTNLLIKLKRWVGGHRRVIDKSQLPIEVPPGCRRIGGEDKDIEPVHIRLEMRPSHQGASPRRGLAVARKNRPRAYCCLDESRGFQEKGLRAGAPSADLA